MKKLILLMFGILLLTSFVSAAHPLPTDFVNDTEGVGLLKGASDWAYDVTNGFYWFLIFIGFCLVMFIATMKYNVDRAFGYAGFVALNGGIFLAILELISWHYASLLILIGAAGITFMIKGKIST